MVFARNYVKNYTIIFFNNFEPGFLKKCPQNPYRSFSIECFNNPKQVTCSQNQIKVENKKKKLL